MIRAIKYSYQSLVYAFLYLPIIVIIIFSFNDTLRSLLWHSFTLKWYQELLQDTDLLRVTWHSLVVGVLSATLASILGTLTAIGLHRYRFIGRKTMLALIFFLILVPDIVLAVALLMLYNFFNFPLGFWSIFLAHTSFCMPFVTVMVLSRIKNLESELVEAAKDLGASDSTILRRILLPLLLPAILAGWLISFTLSLDDVMISFFVSSPTFQILPLKIYSMARLGASPELNALCTIILAITLILILTAHSFMRKKSI